MDDAAHNGRLQTPEDGGTERLFMTFAPARECLWEEIERLLEDTPRTREELTVSAEECSAFGPGVFVYADCGRDVAYKRVLTRDGKKFFYLLSMDIPDFVRRLKKIVSSWGPVMVNPRILDGLCYRVSVCRRGEPPLEYRGRNRFPKNYEEFRSLLGALE